MAAMESVPLNNPNQISIDEGRLRLPGFGLPLNPRHIKSHNYVLEGYGGIEFIYSVCCKD